MGCITMTKGMKRYIFLDICLFQGLAHDPAQTFDAVTTIRFFAVKKPYMRIFDSEILLSPFSHIIRQRNNTIFFVFALTYVNGFAFKIDIRYLHVTGLLRA